MKIIAPLIFLYFPLTLCDDKRQLCLTSSSLFLCVCVCVCKCGVYILLHNVYFVWVSTPWPMPQCVSVFVHAYVSLHSSGHMPAKLGLLRNRLSCSFYIYIYIKYDLSGSFFLCCWIAMLSHQCLTSCGYVCMLVCCRPAELHVMATSCWVLETPLFSVWLLVSVCMQLFLLHHVALNWKLWAPL